MVPAALSGGEGARGCHMSHSGNASLDKLEVFAIALLFETLYMYWVGKKKYIFFSKYHCM